MNESDTKIVVEQLECKRLSGNGIESAKGVMSNKNRPMFGLSL